MPNGFSITGGQRIYTTNGVQTGQGTQGASNNSGANNDQITQKYDITKQAPSGASGIPWAREIPKPEGPSGASCKTFMDQAKYYLEQWGNPKTLSYEDDQKIRKLSLKYYELLQTQTPDARERGLDTLENIEALCAITDEIVEIYEKYHIGNLMRTHMSNIFRLTEYGSSYKYN